MRKLRMFRNPQQIRQRLNGIVEKFRQKGATSPEKAMTIQELGLPPRFEQAMHRRLGQTGIFVEVNGKYYLNEERLKQIQQERANQGLHAEVTRIQATRFSELDSLCGHFCSCCPLELSLWSFCISLFYTGCIAYFPGELHYYLVGCRLSMFVARMLLWRSRRKILATKFGQCKLLFSAREK